MAWTLGILWPALGLGTLVLIVTSLVVGSVTIPWHEVLTILCGGEASKQSWEHIVFSIRLPRTLTSALSGAALAVGGLQMQTLFRNPLADPFLLGISSGASLGVSLVLLVSGSASFGFLALSGFLGNFGIAGAATVGAALLLTTVLVIARKVEQTTTLLIVGLMMGYATSSLVSVLLSMSPAQEIQSYVHWMFGSFGRTDWQQLSVLGPAVGLGLVGAAMLSKPLDSLLLGEEAARSLGQRMTLVRVSIVAGASLLAGSVTAFCGPIAFIGIATPHLCRGLCRTSVHRVLVPACCLVGASLAIFADLVARLPGSDRALPLNAVTALFGAPIVVAIVLRHGRSG